MSERNWSNEFNALPDDVRRIAHMVEVQHILDGLQAEKDEITQHYLQRIREINAQIERMEKELDDNA